MATLSFSTHWPKRMGGQPTYFPDKILIGFDNWPQLCDQYSLNTPNNIDPFLYLNGNDRSSVLKPKTGTIRRGSRWKAGMKIHPVIHNRTKNRFHFAPCFMCKSVQVITISHSYRMVEATWENRRMNIRDVFIGSGKNQVHFACMSQHPEDGEWAFELGANELKELAINDGFDSVEQFFQWFNEDFEGQIIHWSDKKY